MRASQLVTLAVWLKSSRAKLFARERVRAPYLIFFKKGHNIRWIGCIRHGTKRSVQHHFKSTDISILV